MTSQEINAIGFEHPFTDKDRQAVDKMMKGSVDFYYSISEGGWISKDKSMILVTNRFPYNGQLMTRYDVPADILRYWCDKVAKMLVKSSD